jgi:3',5'-cyclic AMP phosphodiesterase CpdA
MDPVYFVHISDTHVGPTADYARYGYLSLPCTLRVIEIINAMAVQPDFVIHTGDVVTHPHPDSYRLAAEVFATLRAPIYYVTGNHDTSADIHHYLPMGPKTDCQESRDVLSYSFDVKGYRFLVLDARGPDSIDPHGLLSEAQLETAAREARPDGPPLAVFTHFPTLPLNSTWMDKNLLILNGERLHETLLPARNRLRGVFYGHIHQATQTIRDGILYASAASTFSQFTGWPEEMMVKNDHDGAPGYSFVHLLENQTIIHQQTFMRPSPGDDNGDVGRLA